ncbi:hypothetical protein SAMN05443639_10423 [Stigmatella erecta]|uniref:Uncharacterized protein n=1 Tax=Stigmatella erecta TaxID=83460 RepID=A0A1I0GLI4_9BACT|nr:hypothetical protein SAMN05443639_10423 [Stigmatella erecta]
MKTALPLLCLRSTGCATLPATELSLPKERATACAANCERRVGPRTARDLRSGTLARQGVSRAP